ncbi:TonB-dependent siderophore receptor [Comamonadaceae bacterium PP-2]
MKKHPLPQTRQLSSAPARISGRWHAVAASVLLLMASGTALAQNLAYDIPAQSLDRTLGQIARQADLQLMLPPALAAGLTSPRITGSLTVEHAVAQALAGSGLEAVREGSTIYVRSRAKGDVTLGAVTVRATAFDNATTENTGRYAAHAVTVGKGEQALREIPQSISVVTQQRLQEQGLISVYDALDATTGITLQQSPQGGKYIYSRGFDNTTIQYDGIPLERGLYGRASNFQGSTVIYDRVEVLRGAAGLLQGSGSPGGAVNLVRKRSLDENRFTVVGKAGSWNHYGLQLDANRLLNEDGSLRGRFVVDQDRSDSFVDYVDNTSTSYYGTLDYDISSDTQISLGASVEKKYGRPSLLGVPRFNNMQDTGLARSSYFGATWNRQDVTNSALYADFTHRFGNDWRFKFASTYQREEQLLRYQASVAAANAATHLGTLQTRRTVYDTHAAGFDANFVGPVSLLGRQHELVAGFNYTDSRTDTSYGYAANRSFDIYNYSPVTAEVSDATIDSYFREGREGQRRQYGVYGAARLQVLDPVKVVLGSRMSWSRTDWLTTTSGRSSSVGETHNRASGRLSPYAGVIYDFAPDWSAYASYSDIFKPQDERTESGASLRPVVGTNLEAGVKGDLFGGLAHAAFAIFRIDQTHRAQADYNTSPTCSGDWYCYTDTGKVRSQGADAEINGELARGWNLYAGYTYTSTRYLRDLDNEGLAFNTYTPRHMLRLWTTYQLPGALSRWTVGGGLNSQTAYYAQTSTQRLTLGGRTIWNGYLNYRISPQWSASLNLNNIFDKTYYSSVQGTTMSYYGDPRNFVFTVRGSF